MADHIKIRPASGTWSVRAGGAVLGESENALELTEGEKPFVIYFPKKDIATEFLDPSNKKATSPHMGVATYYSIVTKSRTLGDAAWSYETPNEPVDEIAGHLAFHVSDTVTVEKI